MVGVEIRHCSKGRCFLLFWGGFRRSDLRWESVIYRVLSFIILKSSLKTDNLLIMAEVFDKKNLHRKVRKSRAPKQD